MPSLAGSNFASGFVGSMANAFAAKQQRARDEDLRQRQNSIQLAQFLINSGQVGDVADLQPLLGHAMPEIFGDKAKKGGKNGIDPAQTIGDILNKSLKTSQGTPLQPGPAATPSAAPAAPAAPVGNLQPGGALDTGTPTEAAPAAPPALPSSQIAIPPAPPPRRTLAGVPLLSPDEVTQRAITRSIGTEQQTITAKIDLARRILPTLRAADPKATLDDALATVGIRAPSAHVFTPGAIGRPINAADVPADATDEQGRPIDKSTAPYWQPFRTRTGDIVYTPGAQPTGVAAGPKPGTEGFHLLQWAKANNVDPKDLTPEQIDKARTEYRSAGWANKASEEEKVARSKDIAAAIQNGSQPPDLSRMYGLSAYVRDELAKSNYNLVQATQDWTATQRYLSSLNGPTQLRYRQAVEAVKESLPLVQTLSTDLDKYIDRTKYPLLNKAAMLAATNGIGVSEDGKNAARDLQNQIDILHTELGTMFQGGGATTNEALKKADTLLQGNWSSADLKTALKLIDDNARIRLNSIQNTGPAGTSATNPYLPGAAGAGAGTPPPAAAPAASGTIAGAVMKNGHLYINGKQID